ncbi:histidine kinase OS=Streptomyces tendae OX=1932 GN=GUR47_05515 PE=4 SV=1 [Streptomyces tendae]
MADAAMRHAEQAVSGRMNDLASLQGTRLGLAVVGRLAAKYGVGVSYRPSSRGGTGVVVLVPPQLLAQQRDPGPVLTGRTFGGRGASTVPGPAPAAESPAFTHRVPDVRPAQRTGLPEQAVRPGPASATPGGLPMRSPGRTMAEAEAERERRDHQRPPADPAASASRDAGASFGAFTRAPVRSGGRPASEPPARAGDRATPPRAPDPRRTAP